ncbi:MAG: hypothetical protein SGI77_23215 [Pirellulaceae bacterium]|nr:hypothetical protein [Pirellulaceae bacterium]
MRSDFPISATEIRRDPFASRAFLDQRVYRDRPSGCPNMVANIGINIKLVVA